jgi:hypothetical protein
VGAEGKQRNAPVVKTTREQGRGREGRAASVNPNWRPQGGRIWERSLPRKLDLRGLRHKNALAPSSLSERSRCPSSMMVYWRAENWCIVSLRYDFCTYSGLTSYLGHVTMKGTPALQTTVRSTEGSAVPMSKSN